MKAIVISHTQSGGYKIICTLKKYLLCESRQKPWNTPLTRKTFLAKLYIEEILKKHTMSKLIRRIDGYEYLGKRCLYKDNVCVVCDAVEVVHQETGEMTYLLTLVNNNRTQPFKILIAEVQI